MAARVKTSLHEGSGQLQAQFTQLLAGGGVIGLRIGLAFPQAVEERVPRLDRIDPSA